MQSAKTIDRSRISALLDNPIGKDLLGRLTQYAGLNLKLIDNPIVRNIRLSSLKKLSGGLVDDALLDTLIDLFNSSTETVSERKTLIVKLWKNRQNTAFLRGKPIRDRCMNAL